MNRIVPITPLFAVTGHLAQEDFAAAAAAGFRSVISNRPDGESPAYPDSSASAALAAAAGLGFRHIPATKFEVFSDRVVGGMTESLGALPGPVLAHCASGMRSAVAWAAAAARTQDAECVLRAMRAAGFNMDALRDELAAQRTSDARTVTPPALDAGCDSA